MTAPRMPLLFLCAATLTAPELCARRLAIQVYTTAQGLPRNSVYCMVPDPNGFLWLCTSEGLVRFDGSDFRTFGREQGLPSNIVHSFVVSTKGGFWLTTSAGVCRLPPHSKVGDTCRLLAVDKLIGTYQQEAMVETSEGGVLVATTQALYRSSPDGRRLQLLVEIPNESINTIGVAPGAGVLIGTGRSLFLWNGKSTRSLTGPPSTRWGFNQIYTASPGDLWVVGSCDLFRLTGWDQAAGPRMEVVSPTGPASSGMIVHRRNTHEWVTGGYGLQYWQDTPDGRLARRENLGVAEGLPYPWLSHLAEDAQGNLWGATTGAGIFRIARTEFRSYREEDGLGSARISSIFESLAGDLCVTTTSLSSDDAASQFRVKIGDRFQPVTLHPGPRFHAFSWGWNQTALQAHDGEWWFQTDRGLFRFPVAARPWDLSGVPPSQISLADNVVFRIFEDSRGDIWLSTDSPNELVRRENATGAFRRWGAADGWPLVGGVEPVATVIRESPTGTLWFGTFDEVLRFRAGRFEKLAVPSFPSLSVVRDLHIDRAGRIWVATAYNGVFRCDNPDDPIPVFRRYSAADGMTSDSTRSLAEDDAGMIYVGTVRGVDRIDPRAPASGGNILHYTAADGLPDAEQNVAFRDRRGHLWFGSLHGLAEFDPSQPADRSAPAAHILRVRVRGEEVPLPWQGARDFSMHLQSNQTQVEIEYGGVDLRSKASLRYQSRLADVDSEWSAPSARTSVNYTSIPPGAHTFQVRTVGADGSVGSTAASIALRLDAPLWRRAWFLGLCALATGSLVYWLYNYRVRHLLALERLRIRIATDLHDDIGASLTQISLLSEVGRRDPLRDVLGDIASISRAMVDEMSDIVWAVSPRHDQFDSIVHRMRHFAEDAMPDGEVDFDTSGLPATLPLPLEYRRPLYLIFKEAVNNVARHAHARRIVVRFALREHSIEMSVEDDGIGFDTAHASRGEGLASIRRRVKELSGSATWNSAPGRGTSLTVAIPVHTSLPKLGAVFARLRG